MSVSSVMFGELSDVHQLLLCWYLVAVLFLLFIINIISIIPIVILSVIIYCFSCESHAISL